MNWKGFGSTALAFSEENYENLPSIIIVMIVNFVVPMFFTHSLFLL
jgi:hypothetical protein